MTEHTSRRFSWRQVAIGIEDWIGVICLVGLVVLPVAQTLLRNMFQWQIPDQSKILRHLILPVTFLGASLASRHKQHLGITLGLQERKDWLGLVGNLIPAFFFSFIVLVFFTASLSSVLQFPEFVESAWFLPLAPLFLFIPAGFLVMLYRHRPKRQDSFFKPMAIAWGIGLLLGLWYSLPALRDLTGLIFVGTDPAAQIAWAASWEAFDLNWVAVIDTLRPFILIALIASTFVGTPLFVVLGGVAALLYAGPGYTQFGNSMSAAPIIEAGYTMIAQDNVPAIALFTFTGFLLSGSQSGERFVRLFKGLFGPIPGGLIFVAVLVSAFFTTFTGASGVTILALGGLLYTILMKSGHNSERFSVGLLTASGSIGLLFPPSLAIILYGAIGLVSIEHLFIAGLIPGALMLVGMIIGGFVLSHKKSLQREPFDPKETWIAFKASFLELLLPILIALFYFTGWCTLSETAAWAALYTFIIEVIIKREISLRQFRHVAVKSLVIVGGVLIILAVARGLSTYLTDNSVPAIITAWMVENVKSPWLFLLILNVLLLVVGCFMDLYSAIMIVVPLITPVAASYGIPAVHLGMIFLANLGVGFLTPPVGMNLFLAAFRFERPLVKIYRDILPFLVIQFVVVLLITYVPWFSTALLPPEALAPPLVL